MPKRSTIALNIIKNILRDEKFECEILAPHTNFSHQRLSVFLGNDNKERERLLQIVAAPQEMGQKLSDSKNQQEEFVKFEFRVFLPFSVHESSIQQSASMLSFFNRYTELQGFELIEEERKICYRYVLFCETKKIDRKLCLAIIFTIIVTLDQFSDAIELVSSGEMTFDDLLEKVLNP